MPTVSGPPPTRQGLAAAIAVTVAFAAAACAPLEARAATWSTTVIEPALQLGSASSRWVAHDADGALHTVFGERALYHRGPAPGGGWIEGELVDATEGVGGWASLAIDGSGALHIAYRDTSAGALRYATDASGVWVWEVVDAVDGAGYGTSIAVSWSGDVHIVHTHEGDGSLWYAERFAGTGSWVQFEVDPGVVTTPYPSVAVDDVGTVHVSYGDIVDGVLYVATLDGIVFVADEVADGWSQVHTSLAVDGVGAPHVVWHDEGFGGLFYSTLGLVAGWPITVVDADGAVGAYPSLALDDAGRAHVAYNAGEEVGYAENTEGPWTVRDVATAAPIDANGEGGARAAISVFPGDSSAFPDWPAPEITFRAGDGEAIAHTWPRYFGSYDDWNEATMLAAIGAGDEAAMVIDAAGRIHLAYITLDGARYASNATGVWRREDITPVGTPSLHEIDLAVDAVGRVHVAMSTPGNGLWHATDAGGSWSFADLTGEDVRHFNIEVDAAGDPFLAGIDDFRGWLIYGPVAAGMLTSVAGLDSVSRVSHAIAGDGTRYVGFVDDGLRLAIHDGVDWSDEVVSAGVDANPYQAMVLDGAGTLHAAYGGIGVYEPRYAVRGAAGWSEEVVDPDRGGNRLAFDVAQDGSAHLVYWGSYGLQTIDRGLWYATNADGTWQLEQLADPDEEGSATAIAMDPWGGVHVVYRDPDSGDLIYQTTAGGYLLEPAVVAFGDVYLESETTRSIQVTNTGAVALGSVPLAVTGPHGDDFRLESSCPYLAPSAQCVVLVTFAPTATGERTARVEAADGQVINLAGTGLGTFRCTGCEGDCATAGGGGLPAFGLVLVGWLGVRRRRGA